MGNERVAGKFIYEWLNEHPTLRHLIATEEVFWINPNYESFAGGMPKTSLSFRKILEAEERLHRFAPFMMKAYPETVPLNGMIESPLVKIPGMQQYLENHHDLALGGGQLWMKCDNQLPISGSIKARGGIYEVLYIAEFLAMQQGLLQPQDDYSVLLEPQCKSFFSQYLIVAGSTGNLGMSIGIMGAQLGFQVAVHMSKEAQDWKKRLLRSRGVQVIEHQNDYTQAVAKGREQAQSIRHCYFIDDENSRQLFFGYAVAALRLKTQLLNEGIEINEDRPLFVYLPCGIGGGPGGITFGLKWMYRDHVHCFFVEPTHSPSMLLGLMTGLHDSVSVQDFGIDNRTAADGLAVGRPSRFVGRTIDPLLSGIYTVHDEVLFNLLRALIDKENIRLEPSALTSAIGPFRLLGSEAGRQYLRDHDLEAKLDRAVHVVWATGGSMVPAELMEQYYAKGSPSD